MMTSMFPVGMFLLIEMEIEKKGGAFDRTVAVITWITRTGERAHKTHFFSFASLKGVTRPAQERNWIFRKIVDSDFHSFVSGSRELNPDFTHPKRTYYRYTTSRLIQPSTSFSVSFLQPPAFQ